MTLSDFCAGDRVVIDASKKPTWHFVDGWRGKVARVDQNAVVVECERVDGLKTFWCPPEILVLSF